MVIRAHEVERHVRIQVVRRKDVEDGEFGDDFRMVERQAVADASAAVVADHRKPRRNRNDASPRSGPAPSHASSSWRARRRQAALPLSP